MEEILAWIYAKAGVSHPKIFMGTVVIISIFFALWLVKKTESAYEDNLGSVEGEVLLHDKSELKKIDVRIERNKKPYKVITAVNGKIDFKLEKGTYTFHFDLDGYRSESKDNIQILNGVINIRQIVLYALPKTIKLKITSKSGEPYTQLTMNLRKVNDHDNSIANLQFDQKGEAVTPVLVSGEYELDLTGRPGFLENSLGGNDIFLWRKFKYLNVKDILVGHFYLPGKKDYENIVFPKVLKTNVTPFKELKPGSIYPEKDQGHLVSSYVPAPNFKKELRVATPLIVNEDIEFCGIGYGSFQFSLPLPERIELVEGNSEIPSEKVLYSSSTFYVGNFSFNPSGDIGYSEFCDKAKPKLSKGQYWLIHTYTSPIEHVSPSGVKRRDGKNLTLVSSDGGKWLELTFPNLNEIAYFIVE